MPPERRSPYRHCPVAICPLPRWPLEPSPNHPFPLNSILRSHTIPSTLVLATTRMTRWPMWPPGYHHLASLSSTLRVRSDKEAARIAGLATHACSSSPTRCSRHSTSRLVALPQVVARGTSLSETSSSRPTFGGGRFHHWSLPQHLRTGNPKKSERISKEMDDCAGPPGPLRPSFMPPWHAHCGTSRHLRRATSGFTDG